MSEPQLYVQKCVLPVDSGHARIPVDWACLAGCDSWKVASCVRIKHAWVQVEPYPSLKAHPQLASHLLLLTSPDEETTLAVYPVSTLELNNNLVVQDTERGVAVLANLRRCIAGKEEAAFVVCGRITDRASSARTTLVASVIDQARGCVGGRPKDPAPPMFWDGLGICTWESFGANRIGPIPNEPTKKQLLDLVPEFPIDVFLIDDGWEDHNRDPGGRKSYPPRARLRSFKAGHTIREDMLDTIKGLKARGVRKVGVWMAMQGYWFGIDPNGELAAKYDCQPHATIQPGQPRGGVLPGLKLLEPPVYQWLPSPERARQFWIDWFTVLKGWGIDFVKVDNQAHMECIQSAGARHALAAMWAGVLEAVHVVWGDMERIIMCMSHNERMLNGPGGLDFGRPTGNLVFRNSDDYNMPYANPHGEFVLWNTRNSILTSHLSLTPDYDMFASNPASHRPVYHALLRAMSVGTVLLSDTPDTDTDLRLLDALTGTTKIGEIKLVRSGTPGIQLSNRWFDLDLAGDKDGRAHFASVWDADNQLGMVGAWNCRTPASKAACYDVLSGADLEAIGLQADQTYAVCAAGLGKASKGARSVLRKSGTDFAWDVVLPEGGCEAFAVSKVWAVRGIDVAVRGLLDKLFPFAAVEVEQPPDGSLQVISRFASTAMTFIQYGAGDLRISVDGKEVVPTVTERDGETELALVLNIDAATADNANGRTVHVDDGAHVVGTGSSDDASAPNGHADHEIAAPHQFRDNGTNGTNGVNEVSGYHHIHGAAEKQAWVIRIR